MRRNKMARENGETLGWGVVEKPLNRRRGQRRRAGDSEKEWEMIKKAGKVKG